MKPSIRRKLAAIYNDPSHAAGFTTADALWKATGKTISLSNVREWLSSQDHYTLHRPVRKRFPRNFYDVNNIDDLWQSDLAQVTDIQRYNDGYKYILVVIDVFSKYGWGVPIKNKTGIAVTRAFETILDTSDRHPVALQTDRGKEYLNSTFQNMLKKRGINYHYTRNPDVKASIAERFIRTLKTRLSSVYTFRGSHRFLDVLPQVLHAYNHSIHRSIHMRPIDVKPSNVLQVWHNLTDKKRDRGQRATSKFKTGDHVRISREKMIFEKGYEHNWTHEIFRIRSVVHRRPLTVYILEDLKGELIEGTFYERELQRVMVDVNTRFKIDKILDARGTGRSRKVLVHWKGYPASQTEWIFASQIRNL